MRGQALNWFRSYLIEGKYSVSVASSNSSTKPIFFEVPQGSILGPLLFIIYINDLRKLSELHIFIMYADDSDA